MRPAILCLLSVLLAAGESDLAGIDGLILPVSAPQSGRPMLVELRLSSRFGAREGQALVVLREGPDEAARWEGPAWRLGTEPTAFRVLLPPARDWRGHDELSAELVWIEDGRRFSLARQLLARAGQEARAVAELAPPGMEAPRELVMPPRTGEDGEPVRAVVARLDPADAPTAAEAWLAWDAVLLHPQAALPPPVREALAAWLLAGGRLALPAGGTSPEVAALLAQAEAAGCGEQRGDGWRLLHAGLGRLVTASAAPGAAAALWARRERGEMDWRERNASPERDLSTLLWPEAVGQVPLTLVLLVFAGFLLWVGPVEWFLLGRLRRRRWTWVTFPLAAIAATWAVTAIAKGAFGSDDHVRRLVLVDCDLAGTPRATTVFEQRFAGGDRELVEQPRGELLLPLQASGNRYDGEGASIPIKAVHTGPWHAGGEVRLALPQWTPVLLRRWRLAPPAAGPRPALGPAPAPAEAEAGLDALRRDGWTYAALTDADTWSGDAGVLQATGRSRRRYNDYGQDVSESLRRHLLGGPRGGQLADLDRGPCRLVARRDGADILVWRQPLRPAATPTDKPQVER